MPEIAARHHLELIDAVVAEAFARAGVGVEGVSLVAATRGPGLVGALLVGFCAAKGFAAARELPFAAVDHLSGHIAAAYLAPARFEPPFLALIASGGHTLLLDVPRARRPVGCSRGRSTTPPARPSTRARGCSGSAIRAARRCRRWRPTAIRTATPSRSGGARTSRSPGSRRRCSTRSARSMRAIERCARTSPPPMSGRSSRRSCAESCARSSAPGERGWRSAAASRRTARCARGSRVSEWSCSCRRSSCAPTTRR